MNDKYLCPYNSFRTYKDARRALITRNKVYTHIIIRFGIVYFHRPITTNEIT